MGGSLEGSVILIPREEGLPVVMAGFRSESEAGRHDDVGGLEYYGNGAEELDKKHIRGDLRQAWKGDLLGM